MERGYVYRNGRRVTVQENDAHAEFGTFYDQVERMVIDNGGLVNKEYVREEAARIYDLEAKDKQPLLKGMKRHAVLISGVKTLFESGLLTEEIYHLIDDSVPPADVETKEELAKIGRALKQTDQQSQTHIIKRKPGESVGMAGLQQLLKSFLTLGFGFAFIFMAGSGLINAITGNVIAENYKVNVAFAVLGVVFIVIAVWILLAKNKKK